MKRIKLAHFGFEGYGGYEWIFNRILKPLTGEFSFELDFEKPDFVFCTMLDFKNKSLEYNCPRIFICEENNHPNFHLYDYWVGYDHGLNYRDRFLYALLCLYNIKTVCPSLIIPTYDQIEPREYFCDFIYSHDDNNRRTHYFDLLSSYKPVTSFGVFKHTVGAPDCGKWPYKEKIEIQKKCKFSLIVETCERSEGLITEKIFHALIAGTIPIYVGEKNVIDIVNPKRIINANDFESDIELLKRIKEIDNNDELYKNIVTQPPLLDDDFFVKQNNKIIEFFRNIFIQDSNSAIRRPKMEGLAKIPYDQIKRKNLLEKFKAKILNRK